MKEVEAALEELLGPRRLRELRQSLSQVIETLHRRQKEILDLDVQ